MSAEINRALRENKFEAPFPIQEAAIPFLLKGVDVVGQAHTGTGKTAAFSLPILTKVKRNGPIQALILVPTRELAMQITTEINKFAKYIGIRTVSIYGGQSINLQHDQLRRGVQIVVATPGRLIDHVKHGSIQLESVKYVVLDEADRMLDMGFIDDIKFILFYVNDDRQTCLFSATMPPEILRLAQEYMKDTQQIRLNEEELSLETIDQSYLIVQEREKFKHLCNLIRSRDKKQTIVFAATKQRTQKLAWELKQEGFKAITIHGDLSQKQRDNAMYRFKKGIEDVLVATDIAARGIDVPAVGHVINYDIPEDPLIYFHRIGRTARAGGTGKAISLVSQDRIEDFGRILRQTEHPIRKLNEELGIEVPVVRYRSHGYRQRRSYGNNSFRGSGSYGDSRGKRSFGSRRGSSAYGGYGGNRSERNRYGQGQSNGDSRRSRYY
ncbi:MAG: DEAD-box ATP-dependent helicase [Nitrososphaeraceae archaeon]|jgi:ATP-dependent RNA helicase DeaD|nr:DEAD-box ATP-dependent helicase [Nitrososphaeraceae archaeon]